MQNRRHGHSSKIIQLLQPSKFLAPYPTQRLCRPKCEWVTEYNFPAATASLLWKFKFGHTKQRGYILYKCRARV